MNEFNKKVIKIFFIILGISLFLFAIAMDKLLKNEKFPPHKYLCPDFWTYKKVNNSTTYMNPDGNTQLLINDLSFQCDPLINYDISSEGLLGMSLRGLNATNYPDVSECYPGARNNNNLYKKPKIFIDMSLNHPENPGDFLKFKNTNLEDEEKLCINYKWTQACGVVWDGVSNAKDPCNVYQR